MRFIEFFIFVVFQIDEISDDYTYKENVKIPCTVILKAQLLEISASL